MFYSGQQSINYLAGLISESDPASSSHWNKYHSDFSFDGNSFAGIQGFGDLDKPYWGIKWVMNQFLQKKYRKMGQQFSEFGKIDKLTSAVTQKQGRAYSLDVLRQSITLAFLRQWVPERTTSDSTVWIIGDGFGTMTSLIYAAGFAKRIVLINLNKTLLVDLWYLKRLLGSSNFESNVSLCTEVLDMEKIVTSGVKAKLPHIIAVQAANHQILQVCPADLVINIASMQEMDPPVTKAYFTDMRISAGKKSLAFYCCNREQKTLPDGTVSKFSEYPWEKEDQILVDELCPWHQEYYVLEKPYYRPYDGPHRHQLRIFTN